VALDEEAVAAIRRADLPPMPADMAGATITLPVTFNFTLR
jgi:TonB family protein